MNVDRRIQAAIKRVNKLIDEGAVILKGGLSIEVLRLENEMNRRFNFLARSLGQQRRYSRKTINGK